MSDRFRTQTEQTHPEIAATIPEAFWKLLAHPAVSLGAYETRVWPIGWERDEFGELVPACSIDLELDRGWCDDGHHGITIESLPDAECALLDITECHCSTCAPDPSDAYAIEEWA